MLFRLVKWWLAVAAIANGTSLYAYLTLVIRNSKRLMFSLCLLLFVASNVYASERTILIYGDSLSAAYGIPSQQGWAHLLSERVQLEKLAYQVVNASISGETTDGGLTRMTSSLNQAKPEIVILELGANDGLRGLPVKNMVANLDAMIRLCKKSGAKVLLVGMKIPPNYGPKYTEEFSQAYAKLAKQHKIALVPFMLENIAAKPELIQQDGLHPNVTAQPMVLENIWPQLSKLLIKKQTSNLNKKTS